MGPECHAPPNDEMQRTKPARAGVARSSPLISVLEGFGDSFAKGGKDVGVADGFIVEALVSCSRSCGAASCDFAQRGAGPLFRAGGQC